jgi:hypothetical protein
LAKFPALLAPNTDYQEVSIKLVAPGAGNGAGNIDVIC